MFCNRCSGNDGIVNVSCANCENSLPKIEKFIFENKIYAVSYGDYSSYYVDSVFTSETECDDYIDKFGGEKEIYTLNAWKKGLKDEYLWYRVCMTKDGNENRVYPMDKDVGVWISEKFYPELLPTEDWIIYTESLNVSWLVTNHKQKQIPGFQTYVYAKNKTAALKIACERRAYLIATQEDNFWRKSKI